MIEKRIVIALGRIRLERHFEQKRIVKKQPKRLPTLSSRNIKL